jgi:serine/threonine-protein kinase
MGLEPWQPRRIESRVGIHLGEIRSLDAKHGAAPDEHIVGLAIDFTGRIMSLGCGGQILLTRAVFDDARQFVRQSPEALADTPPLRWLHHGPYRFKGSDEPVEVCEVGIENFSPLRPPEDTDKARRVVPHDQEEMFGPANPRPAAGFDVPGKPHWRLVRKLGEGGFGEVWLAEHEKLKDQCVFKFCFNADRLRSLKREYTLFRLLKEALGNRPDIARLHEYNLERPPFFLESEYTNGGSLADWAASIGGIDKLPRPQRLELLAKVADAVAAAHSVGVLHKDLKPSNILIQNEPDGRVQPRLADFGIGFLADRTTLNKLNVTETGFTQVTELADGGSSRTGTRMYAPPESVTNQPFTTAGDVYALGVLYYQMAIGDLSRTLAEGWRNDVNDEVLRDDIARCVDRNPANRPAGAAAVAQMLRTVDRRTQERDSAQAAARRSARRARRRRIARAALAGALLLLALAAAAVVYHVRNLHAEQARTLRALGDRDAVMKFLMDDLFANIRPENTPDLAVRDQFVKAILPAVDRVGERFRNKPSMEAAVRHTIAQTFDALGRWTDAEPQYKRALDLRETALGPDHRDTLSTLNDYAMVLRRLGRLGEAEPLVKKALDRRTADFGPDDPDRLVSLNDYGVVLHALHRYDQAESLHKEALDRRTRVLGDDHPDTINSRVNYAIELSAAGKERDAAPLFKDVLESRRRVLGPDHPRTILTLIQYGFAVNRVGCPADADLLFTEAMQRSTRLYGEAHSVTLQATNGHVVALFGMGCADEAEPIARHALELALANPNLGATHPDTIQIAANYAVTLEILQRPAEAAAIREKYHLKG